MVELIEDDERRHEGNRVLELDVLAGYVQLAFDATVLALVIAMVVKFALVVQDDVRCKVQERLAANLRSVADCKRSYELNECLPGMRVPALEESCDKWLHCMNEDVEQLKHGSGSGALWAKTPQPVHKTIHSKPQHMLCSHLNRRAMPRNLSFSCLRQKTTSTRKSVLLL